MCVLEGGGGVAHAVCIQVGCVFVCANGHSCARACVRACACGFIFVNSLHYKRERTQSYCTKHYITTTSSEQNKPPLTRPHPGSM